MTSIEWTDVTWNPTTGCDRVSPGCTNCYAMTMAKRLKAMGSAKYQRDGDPLTSGPGFGVSLHEDALTLPFSWRKPRKVFVNSMSDLFHKDVPDAFIARVFATMALTPQHTYQILTKRHARMRSVLTDAQFADVTLGHADRMSLDRGSGHVYRAIRGRRSGVGWPLRNVWLGVSVEDQHWADIRIPALLKTPAAVRFLSCEPLLGPIDLHLDGTCFKCDGAGTLDGSNPSSGQKLGPPNCWQCNGTGGGNDAHLDWVIAGGESGLAARPIQVDWVRTLRDQCQASGVPFLFKQWGGRTPKANGRELDGRTWDEYPR